MRIIKLRINIPEPFHWRVVHRCWGTCRVRGCECALFFFFCEHFHNILLYCSLRSNLYLIIREKYNCGTSVGARLRACADLGGLGPARTEATGVKFCFCFVFSWRFGLFFCCTTKLLQVRGKVCGEPLLYTSAPVELKRSVGNRVAL